ncbi:hypothetical protein [Streptomyces sp. NPDC094149]|uniref:hypothetical protein n=1 Tax=Streptomyces sp. NPDC094149 TaxID=3155079 RepID=UPI003326562F
MTRASPATQPVAVGEGEAADPDGAEDEGGREGRAGVPDEGSEEGRPDGRPEGLPVADPPPSDEPHAASVSTAATAHAPAHHRMRPPPGPFVYPPACSAFPREVA